MFTDLVGSTALLERLGDQAGTELLRRHFGILRRAVVAHGGREVKALGDGLMVVFSDPAAATACAATMQRGVVRHNLGGPSAQVGLRIGLHSGEALHEAGDYFGMQVVIAKRLCDLCAAGQVMVSNGLRELLGDEPSRFEELGALTLKGISAPVCAASMRWTESALRIVPDARDLARRVRQLAG
jgi:class 3 adenylate cyclase